MDESKGEQCQDDSRRKIEQAPAAIEGYRPAINNAATQQDGGKKEKNWPQRIEALCAVLLVFITGFYTYYARKQATAALIAAGAAKSAADVAQKQLELTERPWLTARMDIGGSGLVFNKDGGASFSGLIILKNVGRSPAIGIFSYQRIVFPHDKEIFSEPLKRQKEACEPLRRMSRPAVQETGINVLFPRDETPPLGFTLGLSKESLEAGIVQFPDNHRRFIAPVIVGCVDYRFTFSPEHHQTGFIYELFRYDPSRPTAPLVIPLGVNLPPEKLRLAEYFFGGKYAD